jgi:anti-sigma factor RsiW
MDCKKAQEEILDACLEQTTSGASGTSRALEAHLSGCPECARFAARQQGLEARLATALVSPPMTSAFRSDLRRKIVREVRSSWSDKLPDVVHFASCGVATACCAFLLPFDAATTLGTGAAAALLTYVLLTTVRTSFEDMEQQDG